MTAGGGGGGCGRGGINKRIALAQAALGQAP